MIPALDPEYDPSSESTYECLDCGVTVTASKSSFCPECGAALRNTGFPME